MMEQLGGKTLTFRRTPIILSGNLSLSRARWVRLELTPASRVFVKTTIEKIDRCENKNVDYSKRTKHVPRGGGIIGNLLLPCHRSCYLVRSCYNTSVCSHQKVNG